MTSSSRSSKETVVTARRKHRREPRRLSRSEIITLDQSTSFNDEDSSSSFEFCPHRQEYEDRKRKESGSAFDESFESLPHKKVRLPFSFSYCAFSLIGLQDAYCDLVLVDNVWKQKQMVKDS